MITPRSFSSSLAATFNCFVELKQALGRQFAGGIRVLHSLDVFLRDSAYPDLTSEAFQAWCCTQAHVAAGVRRHRMLEVYKFCRYRRRTEPACFLPDPALFPSLHQRIRPYIFSENEVARLLAASSDLFRPRSSPLRPEVMRLAIALLFTTGMRRGELLRLTMGDYDSKEGTLLIRASKFYKSRLLPLHKDAAREIDRYLDARAKQRIPVTPEMPLIWNRIRGGRPYTGTGLQRTLKPLLTQCEIRTTTGRVPRIHDFRHSFAVNALLRWYRAGADVQNKLPLLATYLGHVSIVSTHYYLQFIEPLRMLASSRFEEHYGGLVSSLKPSKGRE